MACLCSIALSDEDLLRFVMDGEALPPIAMEHLERCVACQRRLKRYYDANTFYLSRLYRSQCPDTLKLSYYGADVLSREEKMRVACHLAVCPLCVSELKDLQASFSVHELRDIKATDTSDQRSDAMYRMHNDVLSSPLVFNRIMECYCKPDVPCIQPWSRYYHFDEVTLTLHLSSVDHDRGCAAITGVVASSIPTRQACQLYQGVKVELYRKPVSCGRTGDMASVFYETDASPIITTVINRQGELELCNIPPGHYFLIIYLPETDLVIEELHIDLYAAPPFD